MKRFSLYRLLDSPFIYSLAQRLLAPGASLLLKKQFMQLFSESKGLILDVGCGPELSTLYPNGFIIGIDINPYYVKKYSMQHVKSKFFKTIGNSINYGVVCSSDAIPFKSNTFNESRCKGLLHHLSPKLALLTITEMIRCTYPNGRIVIFDNVWPRYPCFRPLAWLTRKLDRGKLVRTEEELLQLIDNACADNYQYKRLTYTYTGLEALIVIIRKPESM